MYAAVIDSPIGKLGLQVSDGALVNLVFLPPRASVRFAKEPVAKEVAGQLGAYFKDPKFRFDFPIYLSVTPFQQRVLDALQDIPIGETQSYGELANRLKTGARAIGGACRRNPLPIVIPCHRVVAKTHMGGFSGATEGRKMAIKRWLLEHERCSFLIT